MAHSNVIDQVVAHDLCIGCGVCAGVCPNGLLQMEWGACGELIPLHSGRCPAGCSVCLCVCPFFSRPQDPGVTAQGCFGGAAGVQHDETLGYYRSCFSGYALAPGLRESGASGGMASWFLESLLIEGKVDRVAAVGRDAAPERLFSYRIAETPGEVRGCAGSAYYPVELSGLLRSIARDATPLRYALVALPCAAYALRRAREISPLLARRITVIASLTCGQLQNRYCSEYLSLASGIALPDLAAIDFRRKFPGGDPADFAHVPVSHAGVEGRPLPYQGVPLHLSKYRYFTHNACNYCDDVFGETADITFMDAWLPEFGAEWRGTSLVIARSDLAHAMLQEARRSACCHLEEAPVEKVIKSQQGVVFRKGPLLAARLYGARQQGIAHPRTRVTPSRAAYRRHRRFLALTREIQLASKRLWPRYRDAADTAGFDRAMAAWERDIASFERREKLVSALRRLLGPLRRLLWDR